MTTSSLVPAPPARLWRDALPKNQDAQSAPARRRGGEDMKPGILITETWFFNQGGEFDWSFAAESSPSVNNRSITQAHGQGHRRRYQHQRDGLGPWSQETTSTTGPRKTGDNAWNYRHVLDIYRRIEDWHGVPDPQTARQRRRGSSFSPLPIQAPSRRPSSGPQRSLGIPTFADQNGIMQEGSGGAGDHQRAYPRRPPTEHTLQLPLSGDGSSQPDRVDRRLR